MVLSLLVVFGLALGFIEYGYATTVSLTVSESPHASIVVFYGSANATIPENQSAVVQLPPHANVTIEAFPEAPFQVQGWSVSGVSITNTGQDKITLLTGSGGSSIVVSVELSDGPSGTSG